MSTGQSGQPIKIAELSLTLTVEQQRSFIAAWWDDKYPRPKFTTRTVQPFIQETVNQWLESWYLASKAQSNVDAPKRSR